MSFPGTHNTRAVADPSVSHRAVLAIALPIVAANISTPLIGIVDTAVIGQLEEAYLIGAIAIGALIFNFIYWAFAFLRMGTTGFAAQASGAGDDEELRAVLGRALLVAVASGFAIVALQVPIETFSFWAIDASGNVEDNARTYYAIRIWSAPAALLNFAILGWFIGLGRTGVAFTLQIVLNVTNIVMDMVLVLGFDMSVAGVAYGTVIAELVAVAAGIAILWRELARRDGAWDLKRICDPVRIRKTIAVNADIVIRTLCLLFAFSFFTAQSATYGDVILAANAVLMNLVNLTSYLSDGFAYAAETLAGKAFGAGNKARFHRAVVVSSLWAFVISVGVSACFLVFGPWGIDIMTVNEEVRSTANAYLFWVVLCPVLGVAAFQFDGVYIGATRTADMRNYMLLSVIIFLAAWWLLTPIYGNHGLWAALLILLIVRGIFLGCRYPALLRDGFDGRTPVSHAAS